MDGLEPLLASLVLLLLTTCFVKVLTVLQIVRLGFGLQGFGFGAVFFALALGISAFVMAPLLSKGDVIGGGANAQSIEAKTRSFMEQHTDRLLIDRLIRIDEDRGISHEADAEVPTYVLAPAFLASELRDAFEVGLILIIPLLVIDLLVINGLMVLGAQSLKPQVVAVPLKLLAFLAADGWGLISERLITGYL